MMKLTSERAIRRFLQIRAIEETVVKIEASIKEVKSEIDDGQRRLGELRAQKSELLEAMRDAAKDTSQLPLFDDLAEQLADLGVPRELLPTEAALASIAETFIASIPEGCSMTMSASSGGEAIGEPVHVSADQAAAARRRRANRGEAQV